MTKGCYMPNIYAFIGPQKGHPLYLNKSESATPKHVSYQVWLKLWS